MSIYVMSDIHGHYDEFEEMLNKIEFSDDDELILAGDYVDRGSQTLEMLQWVEECPENVLLLKGNHDAEFAECISIMEGYCDKLELTGADPLDTMTLYRAMQMIPALQSAYFDYYGTINDLVMNKGVTLNMLRVWASLIKEMPFVYKRTVNGKKYIVVHAGYCEDNSVSREELEQFYIYAREEAYTVGGVPGTTIIAGHTPTVVKGTPMFTGGEVFRLYDRDKDCTFYDIDCGCGYKESDRFENCRLACIRLEDEEVFYI